MRIDCLCGAFVTLICFAVVGEPLLNRVTGAELTPTQPRAGDSIDTPRSYLCLDTDWRFSKGDRHLAMLPEFDDTGWRRVDVPHDWSSEGPFGPEYASCTGYAPGGIAWYRKRFRLDEKFRDKLVSVEFDGVYNNAEVWCNGHFVGSRPYGYSSFECILTPLVEFGTNENVLAVRVDHSRFADSRWYTGSGIYRRVRLRLTDKLRIGQWGVFVTTPDVTKATALIRVETLIENDSGKPALVRLHSEIIGPDGSVVSAVETPGTIPSGTNHVFVQEIRINQPKLWSPSDPVLYRLKSRVYDGERLADAIVTPFGIRTVRFDPSQGFFLNCTPMKLKGVCLHHDAGCLGAAVPERVWERRLRTLKEIGVNAIRTSHNPAAPEFLDLCDRLGFLVMAEAFDEFTPAKNKWVTGWNMGRASRFGYAEVFEQWALRDLQDMVRRDRNHPCIIMWSIGNEIDYPNDPFSHPVLGDEYRQSNPPAENIVQYARTLVAAVKQFDPTRPVTMALAHAGMSEAVGLCDLLDVVGYNYQEARYSADHAAHPDRIIIGSETRHRYADWLVVRDNEFVSGQFLWTGIDYLGEAGAWPNRANGSGLLDLCGFKKPLAWFRQSLWSDKPMVYLCASVGMGETRRVRGGWLREHWNWPSNATVTVHCYTTCQEVELLLNGRSLGKKRNADATEGALLWQVRFEPGKLQAYGLKDGCRLCEFALQTAGEPQRIALYPDVTELRADGRDVCHLEFRIVDAAGVRVPDATNAVTLTVTGPADLLGIETGNLNDPDTGKTHTRNAYQGRGLAILRAQATPGKIVLTATSPGLNSAMIELESR